VIERGCRQADSQAFRPGKALKMLSDVVLETARAIVMAVIFAFMIVVGHRQNLYEQRGYAFIVGGLAFFSGRLLDITDNTTAWTSTSSLATPKIEAFFERS
jgi:hypothetical protein